VGYVREIAILTIQIVSKNTKKAQVCGRGTKIFSALHRPAKCQGKKSPTIIFFNGATSYKKGRIRSLRTYC
jgi:hypothetical protein